MLSRRRHRVSLPEVAIFPLLARPSSAVGLEDLRSSSSHVEKSKCEVREGLWEPARQGPGEATNTDLVIKRRAFELFCTERGKGRGFGKRAPFYAAELFLKLVCVTDPCERENIFIEHLSRCAPK